MRAGKLFILAILVRLLFLILSLLADSLSPDYDNSMMAESSVVQVPVDVDVKNDKNNNQQNNQNQQHQSPRRVYSILDPLMRWDAVHFRYIAKYGYTHEHLCAFFPQVPNIFLRLGLVTREDFSKKIDSFFLTSTTTLPSEIVFLALHILAFGIATLFLRTILIFLADRLIMKEYLAYHRIQNKIKKNNKNSNNKNSSSSKFLLTTKTSPHFQQHQLSHAGTMRPALLVWLINPASIFFTAAYTETYFALVAFAGMLCIQKLHFYSGFTAFSGNHSSINNDEQEENDEEDENDESDLENINSDNDLPVRFVEKDVKDPDRRSPSPNSPTTASLLFKNTRAKKMSKRVHIEQNSAIVQHQQQENNIDTTFSDTNIFSNNNSPAAMADSALAQEQERKLNLLITRKTPMVSFPRAFTWAVAAALCFYVATTLRSNGILLAGFLIHFSLCRLWFDNLFAVFKLLFSFGDVRKAKEARKEFSEKVSLKVKVDDKDKNKNEKKEDDEDATKTQQQPQKQELLPFQKLLLGLICLGLCGIIILPYKQHIERCYKTFCEENYNNNNIPLQLMKKDPLVCNPEKGVSGFYSGIQYKYWKVGLFEYFTPNNIPNFIIAVPTFLFCGIGLWFRFFFSEENNNNNSNQKVQNRYQKSPKKVFQEFVASVLNWIPTLEACHIVYLFAQLLFAFLTMNVQVVTRFVAASPALYYLYGELLWKCTVLTEPTGKLIEPFLFSTSTVKKSGKNNKNGNNDQQQQQLNVSFISKWKRIAKYLKPLCCGFVLVWAAVGTAMFPNFMPWT